MKNYKIVAYRKERYECQIQAESLKEAMDLADNYNPTHPAWYIDPEYYSFDVAFAEEETEE